MDKVPDRPALRKYDSGLGHDLDISFSEYWEEVRLVARAWIRNEPTNISQAPRPRSPTPDQESDSETEDIVDNVYKLPPPLPLPPDTDTLRIPPTPPVTKSLELDLDLDQANAPPKELLLSNHLVKWWGVRKSWKKAASDNEKRYQKSLTILKDMQEK